MTFARSKVDGAGGGLYDIKARFKRSGSVIMDDSMDDQAIVIRGGWYV